MVIERIGLLICDADVKIVRKEFPDVKVRKTYSDIGFRLRYQIENIVEWVSKVGCDNGLIGWNGHWPSGVRPVLDEYGVRHFTMDLPYDKGIYFRSKGDYFGVQEVSGLNPQGKDLNELIVQIIKENYI